MGRETHYTINIHKGQSFTAHDATFTELKLAHDTAKELSLANERVDLTSDYNGEQRSISYINGLAIGSGAAGNVHRYVKKNPAEQAAQLIARLMRLGGRYERAQLKAPREYDAMKKADDEFKELAGQADGLEMNAGLWFRRGRNIIRRARRLEEVGSW